MRSPAAPPPEDIQQWMEELVKPAVYAQLAYYRQLGLRERVLSLPVVMALLLTLLWRQVGSVCELVRMFEREGLLWTGPTRVSQQALSQRLHRFPAAIVERVLWDVMGPMQARWQERSRPQPATVARAQQHFGRLLVLDGSTLDGLLRKLDVLASARAGVLAGRIGVLLDLASRLPVSIHFDPDPAAHDMSLLPPLEQQLASGDLVLFDRGFLDAGFFGRLTERGVFFLTRPRSNARVRPLSVLARQAAVHDTLVEAHGQTLRLIELLVHGKWYRYLTNVLDPQHLAAVDAADLYGRRWSIEEVFRSVKRLLGLSYIWAGSVNSIQLQVWSTWLIYAMLVDLTDAIADRLHTLFEALSIEMVYRGLYHYVTARNQGDTRDAVSYLADQAHGLAIIKRPRPRHLTATAPA
jgi:hypothetical protein